MAQQQQRQPKKTQKRFDTLFADAMSFYRQRTGDHQAKSEKFLQAVHAAPLLWTKHRFYAFSSFLYLASTPYDSMTQGDIDAITARNLETETNIPIIQAQQALLLDRVSAGGKVCDCCGKTLEELQIPSFKRCSRCEMVFYCSPTCQRAHWKKKGHKQTCREKGQIEIGDDMAALPTTQPDGTIHCSIIKVLSSLGGDRWQVKHHGSGEVVIVNGADLIRLRPPSTLSC